MAKAQAVLVQSIHLYWDMMEEQNEPIRKLKPACLALFAEENGSDADPFEIVCASEPLRFKRGHLVLRWELVPAWTLYINRANDLITLLERFKRDHPR